MTTLQEGWYTFLLWNALLWKKSASNLYPHRFYQMLSHPNLLISHGLIKSYLMVHLSGLLSQCTSKTIISYVDISAEQMALIELIYLVWRSQPQKRHKGKKGGWAAFQSLALSLPLARLGQSTQWYLGYQRNMAEGTITGSSAAAKPPGMRAVMIGSTGAIGEHLLGELLSSKVRFCENNPFQTILYRDIFRIYFTTIWSWRDPFM